MDSLEKRSTKSLSGYYDKDRLTNYEEYNEDDIPMSMEEKALVRKIDLFLMPLVCLIDFFQYIDKATLTYAVTLDFNKDLKLTGFQFSFIASIFYLGYLLYQLPNNYFLQKAPIKKYIGFLLFTWGTVIACTAACNSFAQVAAMRFLLGFFEAGIYPALTLLISTFYRRSEQAARLGLFWIFNGIATIVGGLVSYGVATMGPSHGLSKWRWLMLILGCATCATGVLSYFFLIDNPKSSALKLNAEQEILVEERTRDNAVVRTTTIKKEQIYEALKEVRFWCFCISCFLMNLQNGAMSAYVSQIALNFGFTGIQASFITLGGGAAVILWIGGSVLLVQRINQTIYMIAVLMLIDVVGLILLLVITDVRLKLIGIYIMWAYTGAYVLIVASISNNVTGYTKKIFYNGMFMIFYTIGNFVGPFLMVEDTKPSYAPAIITYICCNFVTAILVLIARMKMAAVNKKRISNPSAEIINVEDDLTDVQDPNFLYRL
ncbi:hypothetical protein G6F43_006556 [Rhizopus delemar]|nr:hypothetical protein G6F43_006556 [Rhizopus delemar]